jgi:hypothetical protein
MISSFFTFLKIFIFIYLIQFLCLKNKNNKKFILQNINKMKMFKKQKTLTTAPSRHYDTFDFILIGDANIGKTCLLNRFCNDFYSSYKKKKKSRKFLMYQLQMIIKNLNCNIGIFCSLKIQWSQIKE